MVATEARRRSRRLEVRTTPEERALIDRAVEVQGGDLTDFVVSNLVVTAHRVLADRAAFVLDDAARAAWDKLNARPARELAGVRALLGRPNPFDE